MGHEEILCEVKNTTCFKNGSQIGQAAMRVVNRTIGSQTLCCLKLGDLVTYPLMPQNTVTKTSSTTYEFPLPNGDIYVMSVPETSDYSTLQVFEDLLDNSARFRDESPVDQDSGEAAGGSTYPAPQLAAAAGAGVGATAAYGYSNTNDYSSYDNNDAHYPATAHDNPYPAPAQGPGASRAAYAEPGDVRIDMAYPPPGGGTGAPYGAAHPQPYDGGYNNAYPPPATGQQEYHGPANGTQEAPPKGGFMSKVKNTAVAAGSAVKTGAIAAKNKTQATAHTVNEKRKVKQEEIKRSARETKEKVIKKRDEKEERMRRMYGVRNTQDRPPRLGRNLVETDTCGMGPCERMFCFGVLAVLGCIITFVAVSVGDGDGVMFTVVYLVGSTIAMCSTRMILTWEAQWYFMKQPIRSPAVGLYSILYVAILIFAWIDTSRTMAMVLIFIQTLCFAWYCFSYTPCARHCCNSVMRV